MDRWPHIRGIQVGDEGIDLCDINDKVCLLESGDECYIWEEHKQEERDNAGE
uniref:Uncharacterized protein n=1 Tax=viral metagenome TaxID=1070528 RepID=A0A6H1ZPJ6_9ZZZZ